jgi:hypothetical protein
MREFQDAEGRPWQVLVVEYTVAHGRRGTRLAFRPARQPDAEPLPSPISFNSIEAGEFAVHTMSNKELKRRLAMTLATSRVDEHTLPPTSSAGSAAGEQ